MTVPTCFTDHRAARGFLLCISIYRTLFKLRYYYAIKLYKVLSTGTEVKKEPILPQRVWNADFYTDPVKRGGAASAQSY